MKYTVEVSKYKDVYYRGLEHHVFVSEYKRCFTKKKKALRFIKKILRKYNKVSNRYILESVDKYDLKECYIFVEHKNVWKQRIISDMERYYARRRDKHLFK